MSDYLDPVVVELEGRDRKLLDTLTRAKAEVRRFVADVGRMNATIKVDAKLKDGALAEIRRRVNDGPAAKLKVDLQLAAGQRDQLRAQLEGRPITANVRPVMDQSALRRVQMVLQELGRRIDVQIRPDMDTAAQRRAQRRLDRMSQDRTVVIRTRVIGDTNHLPGAGGAGAGGGSGALGALLTLAPALVPIAAQATVVAAQMGAATVAVGAFGLAVKSQLGAVSGLSDAQAKASEAVAKYGAGSQQAAQAQQALSQTVEAMPAQTLKAAGAFLVLKQDFQNWSNSLARFTMVPVTQGIGVLDALLPKLSPLVKDTSAQFTRLTTLLAGGINSGAFDGLMGKFTAFTNGVLRNAVDGVVHFVRVLSEGGGSGGFSEFMAYAKANAPLVKETLKNLADAVLNIMRAASQAGPGMLSLVNVFAKLVAALPPSVIATLMQVAAAIKLVKLASGGLAAAATGVQALATRIASLRAASAGAGGGLAGLRAAFLSLSTAARATVIVAGIAAVVAVLAKLSESGKKAPDVDRMTTAIGNLGRTGQVTGEALRVFGKGLDGLAYAADRVGGKSEGMDKFNDVMNKVFTLGMGKSNSLKDAEKQIDALDKGLANLVQGGKPQLAAAALKELQAAYAKKGGDPKKLAGEMDDYKSALADAALEQKLTADSMGLFGAQAQKTSAKLDAQKASADGLRQSIQALNDVNRAGLGGMIAFNQSLADTAKAAKTNAGALSMTHGELNLNSQKARDAASALQDLADKTDSAASSAREANQPWSKVNSIYSQGRAALIKNAEAMGLSASQAKHLADQILKIPDKTAKVKMDTEDAVSQLNSFNSAVKRAPNAKSVTLKTLSSTAEQVLQSFGYKVTHLKNGSVKVSAATGSALAGIRNVQGAVNSLHGKTITIMTQYFTAKSPGQLAAAHGRAHGGLAPGYAGGGHVQTHPNGGLVSGPGSSTSDSVLEMSPNGGAYRVSDREYIVQARAVDKYGVGLLDALNAGHLKMAAYAKGGVTKAEKQARAEARGDLTISHFGYMAGYKNDEFRSALGKPADVSSLVNALNQWASIIKKSTHGGQEKSLLKALDSSGKKLLSWEKQLGKVSASLEKAKDRLDGLKDAAAQLKASVAASIMQNVSVVTQAPQEGFGLTSQDVVNSMSAQLSKTLTFSNQLQELKKRGLSADLLEQLASAGVDQGGATVAALAGASDNQLKQLNQMQSQLKTSANKAGSAVSDAMYGAGIKAAEGLVAGLEKKQKAIEDQMMKIAKSMEKSIKKALGIKSPSTVMARVGDYTALGMAAGIARSSKHAVIAARGMAMSVAQGATLTGTPTPTWAGVPMGGGRGGTVVNNYEFNFKVEGSVATIDRLAKDVETAFLRRGMRNPATYAPYKR